jgi:hypothetical protein
MFELAERLVGIYKVNHMTKSVTVENRDYLGLQRQAAQARLGAMGGAQGGGAQGLQTTQGVGGHLLGQRQMLGGLGTQQSQASQQSSRPLSREAVQESQSPVKQSPTLQGKPVANQLLVSPSQAQMQTELDASVARTEESVIDETENTIQ